MGHRIAFVFERTSFDCASVWQMFEVGRELARRGHRVVALSSACRTLSAECTAVGVRHLVLPLRHRGDVVSMRALARLSAEEGIDLVHTHRGTALEVALGAHLFGSRFGLVVERGVTFPLGALNRMRFRSRRLHRVVASCEAVRRALVVDSAILEGKVAVAYPGVDLARWDARRADARAAREALGVPPEARLVGHVGLRVWQGWKELLQAMPAVLPEHPGAHLVLLACRSPRQRHDVVQLASEMGLAGSVRTTLADEHLPDLLAACDVVVDASWAGTGISGSIREAMALGKPVVATACGGMGELIEDGVSGILTPPRDVPTLAAAVARVLRDGELAARLGEAGRERVSTAFTTERRADALESIYADVVATLPRPA